MVPSAVGGHGGGSAGNHSSSSTSSTLPANFCSPSVGAGSTGHSLQLRELEKLIKAGKVTFNQIRGWSMSFECLLHDKFGLALFHDFLRSEFSDENIEFWIACEEYRTIANMRKLQMRAEKIYNDFVGVQAAREVNLDSRTRQQTELDIQQPSQTTFDTAQKRIQALMEKDSYQRFLRSELYCRLLRLVSQQHAPAPPAAPVAPHSQSRGPTIGSLGLTAHDLSRLTMTTSKLALVPVPPPARPKPAPTTSPTNPSCTVNTVQPDEPCLPFYQTSLIYSPAKK